MCGDTEQKLEEVYGVGLTRGRRLPLIQVIRGLRENRKGRDLSNYLSKVCFDPHLIVSVHFAGAHDGRDGERGDGHQRAHHRGQGEER